MTIKRYIIVSNIRTVLVTLLGLFLIGFVFQLVMFEIMGANLEDASVLQEMARQGMEYESQDWPRIFALIYIVFSVALISIITNLLNYRLIKYITRPLQPLGEGVRHIHDNNLGFRINYQNDDEYRPICDAFNEMAAKLEESAARRQKDEANRRELIAGISHDLRTPLTSIKGYLEGLETGVASTPEMRDHYFTTIKNKTDDMEHIIEQLFLFSKLDMDEFPLALRRVPLMPAIRDMIEEVAQEYDQRGLTVHITESHRDVFVLADMIWFRNVLINILENSVRYKTKDPASMEISAGIVNNSVFLRFADNGPGVSAEVLPKLFDVFYRADPSRSIKGSGLGLAISKKIIERMGGAIHAELPGSGGLAVVIRMPIVRDR
ncbi:HAMP domain-containing histidine kinase [Treponema sp. TIM-1]|uniref:sensor histidine kinase n=1 Tax=Treponema sp. TIM-1 TaxID=2898417 RepID=UPI00398021C2